MFLPGIERHADLRNLDVENRRRLGVEPGAIDGGSPDPSPRAARRPRCASAGARRECRRSTECRRARRRESPCGAAAARGRARSARRVPRRLHDHEIVGDEPVAALDEIEHALRLSDAALPDEQQPDAEHVGERAVQVRRRRELLLEPRLEPRVELVRLEPRADQRDARRPPRARADRSSAPDPS